MWFPYLKKTAKLWTVILGRPLAGLWWKRFAQAVVILCRTSEVLIRSPVAAVLAEKPAESVRGPRDPQSSRGARAESRRARVRGRTGSFRMRGSCAVLRSWPENLILDSLRLGSRVADGHRKMLSRRLKPSTKKNTKVHEGELQSLSLRRSLPGL